MPDKNISLQLYSCKDATAVDFKGTLEKVAKIGYKGVELAGYGGLVASEMKERLETLDLTVTGAHLGIDELKNNLDYHIEYNKTIGNKYLICPFAFTDTEEQTKKIAEDMKMIAEKLSGTGLILGYHNHANEFNVFNDEYAFDTIVSSHPEIIYELDCYWSEYSNVDTCEYFKKIGRRCHLVHLKDMCIKDDGTKDCSIFGEGVLENRKFIDAARKYCEPKWFVIEWEAFDMDCFEAVERSFINLEKML